MGSSLLTRLRHQVARVLTFRSHAAVSRPIAPRRSGRDAASTASCALLNADTVLIWSAIPAQSPTSSNPHPSSSGMRVAPYVNGDAEHVLAQRRSRSIARWQRGTRIARDRSELAGRP